MAGGIIDPESPLTVIVLHGGSNEFPASTETVTSIHYLFPDRNLVYLDVPERLSTRSLKRALEECLGDHASLEGVLVFIAMYGPYAQSGDLAAQLEELGIPYTGSEPHTALLTYDKLMFKAWCAGMGLTVQRHEVFDPARVAALGSQWPSLPWPAGSHVVVKPVRPGAAESAFLVRWGSTADLTARLREALDLDRSPVGKLAIVGQYITGREFVVMGLGGVALPTVAEQIATESPKPFESRDQFEMQLLSETDLSREMTGIATRLFADLGGCDYGRLDLVKDEADGRVYITDINTRPPLAGKVAGLVRRDSLFVSLFGSEDYPRMCRIIMELARSRQTAERFRMPPNGEGAMWGMFRSTSELLRQGLTGNLFIISEVADLLDRRLPERLATLVNEFDTPLERVLAAWERLLAGGCVRAGSIWRKLWARHAAVRSGVDPRAVRAWVADILRGGPIDDAKQDAVTELLTFIVVAESPFAADFLWELSRVDILDVTVGYDPAGLTRENLFKAMLWEDTLSKCLQEAYKFWHDLDPAICERVRSGIVAIAKSKNGHAVHLHSAGQPVVPPKTARFEAAYKAFVQGKLRLQPFDSFYCLFNVLQDLVELNFGPGMQGYPTRGTLRSFQAVLDRAEPKTLFVVCTPGEFGPMVSSLEESSTIFVNIENIDFTVEDLTDNVVQIMETYPDRPLVFLISSCLRIGGRYLDLRPLRAKIQAAHTQPLTASRQLWVDAAQDHRVVHADVVFYSKRFAGTGGGLVAVHTGVSAAIREKLEVKSGYDTVYLVRVCKTLVSALRGVYFGFEDMLMRPNLWDAATASGEILRSVRVLEAALVTEHLSSFVDVRYNLEEIKTSQPMPGAIVRLTPSALFTEHYSIGDLVFYLATNNIGCETFSLSIYYSNPANVKQAVSSVAKYREFSELLRAHRDVAVWYPHKLKHPPDHESEYFEQCARLTLQYHDYLRIFLTYYTSDRDLGELARNIRAYIVKGDIYEMDSSEKFDICEYKALYLDAMAIHTAEPAGLNEQQDRVEQGFEKALAMFQSSDRVRIWSYRVANASNMLAAFAVVDVLGDSCCILSLVVAGAFQRKGVGSTLLKRAQAHSSSVSMQVELFNLPAICFCEKHMFRVLEAGEVTPSPHHQTGVEQVKTLTYQWEPKRVCASWDHPTSAVSAQRQPSAASQSSAAAKQPPAPLAAQKSVTAPLSSGEPASVAELSACDFDLGQLVCSCAIATRSTYKTWLLSSTLAAPSPVSSIFARSKP